MAGNRQSITKEKKIFVNPKQLHILIRCNNAESASHWYKYRQAINGLSIFVYRVTFTYTPIDDKYAKWDAFAVFTHTLRIPPYPITVTIRKTIKMKATKQITRTLLTHSCSMDDDCSAIASSLSDSSNFSFAILLCISSLINLTEKKQNSISIRSQTTTDIHNIDQPIDVCLQFNFFADSLLLLHRKPFLSS